MAGADHAALAVLRAGTTVPSVSRIALAMDDGNRPISLISKLADHTKSLQANPACALLVGTPDDKGDPLVHPRLTLHCSARLIPRDTQDHRVLRERYLALRPKSRLYIDFTDFNFVVFEPVDGLLNGGFGKAWRLTAEDL